MGQLAPTMAGIKQALNHRSLSQFEQWWLVEQVEILRIRCEAAEDFWRAVENVVDSDCYLEFGDVVTEALLEYRGWRRDHLAVGAGEWIAQPVAPVIPSA